MSNTALVRHGKQPPGSSQSTVAQLPPPSLLCNLCQKPLATTCFLCACDCIFCEDCTYAHFEQSSSCPTCGKTLSEKDFTELVVAEATSSSTDIAKTSLQALFSRQSKNRSRSNGLPFSDLCFSLIRQIDVVKQSTKFLLKQMLMDSSMQGRKTGQLIKHLEAMKVEVTRMKQSHQSQRIQLEQINMDLQNRLKAREADNAELHKKIKAQERMLEQFRNLHGGIATGSGNVHTNPSQDHSSGMLQINDMSRDGIMGHRQQHLQQQQHPEPPLKGFMKQKEAQMAAQQQAFNPRRQPNVLGSSKNIPSQNNGLGNYNYQSAGRPFSNSSTGSINTPRIRELSSGASYNFSGKAGSSSGQERFNHMNKRRREDPSLSNSSGIRYAMSPTAAFTQHQGGQRWRRSGGAT